MERFVVELERYVLAQGRSVLLAEPFGCAVVAKARYCLKQRCLFLCREPDAKLLHALVLCVAIFPRGWLHHHVGHAVILLFVGFRCPLGIRPIALPAPPAA